MKKLISVLALLLACAMLFTACAQTGPGETTASSQAPSGESSAPTETTPPETTGKTPAIYDSVADFNYEEGQTGVWQYYFSGDNGETYDPCGSYDDYGTVRGWHPWEGSYIGVGFNDDVPDFLELNTDGHSTNFSNQMGVLAFVAPEDGKYVLTAAVWNPWEQDCEKFTFKRNDGTVIYEQDMTDLVAVYGYIQPTDVELKAGDIIYMYLNAAGSEWVSGYIAAKIYYEPADDSCYEIPEVPEPTEPEPAFEPTNDTAAYNAFNDFDNTAADGANVPWVYAATSDGVNFANAVTFTDTDYGTHQWFSEGGTGIGPSDSLAKGWLEVNTTASDGEMTAIGFKAPADGTYTISGYTQNPYGQPAGSFHLVLNGEEVGTAAIGSEVTEFSVDVELKAGEIVYLYCDSTGDWVSASLAVYANPK